MANDTESTPGSDRRAVADALHSAAIHLLRRVRRVDEASGLTAARLSALSVLVFGGPTTLGRLARAEQVSAPTMSRLVSGLVRDGLAVREAESGDRRAVRVRATAEGRRLLERGRRRRIAELERLLAGLGDAEVALLGEAAGLLRDVAARDPSAASAYAGATAERRWSGLSDDSTGSGGASG
ncbi:MAG TPA: MarR family transcriptional regulator [Gaiellaceae bacterium]|nr:MarR family transcriptional regulator [Gaiellaceae bacterium]